MILRKLFDCLKKQYYLKLLKRKYYRFGSCAMCGACCRNIYVRHKDKIIKTREEFEKIKETETYSFYHHINVIDCDDFGLVFECQKFDKERNICKEHKKRPGICRNYPSEEIFKMGACLKEDCGYYFKPIESFRDVYLKVSKKPLKKFEEFTD